MKQILAPAAAAAIFLAASLCVADIVTAKHLIPAPPPIDEPHGVRTPDGTFNIRDPGAPFYSEKLADALGLDAEGRNSRGDYLNLNHAIYTSYRLSGAAGPPDTILILMPGTWAGAMSLDRFALDLLRLAEEEGWTGLEVWLLDRRSEQLEDHTGVRWAEENRGRLSPEELIEGISAYYRPAFLPGDPGSELLGRRFIPLDHDALRFMAAWGADVAIRDWRAVVLEAHRQLGNEVMGEEIDRAVVKKKPGRRLFIGGHSLGGGLTVMYASYDFDRRPDHELLGKDDVDGLVLLEGGSGKARRPHLRNATAYRRSVQERYQPESKVYFDFNILGIRYAPSTMLSVAIMGWSAVNAPDEECRFPAYARPAIVQLPRLTNLAVLGWTMDDDTSPFFIARASLGFPAGELGRDGQLRRKAVTLPVEPGECPLLTPWLAGHRPRAPEFIYSWKNIDAGPHPYAARHPGSKCAGDDAEVTDALDFARSLYAGPHDYVEAPGLGTGPNDFPEWYFPPRLSTDAAMTGVRILDRNQGLELFNASAADRLDLPVISFTGDDSSGEYVVPELSEKDFAPGILAHPQTQVHLLKGYTHLDITAATRNNQPALIAAGRENYNGCAVYTFEFMKTLAGR